MKLAKIALLPLIGVCGAAVAEVPASSQAPGADRARDSVESECSSQQAGCAASFALNEVAATCTSAQACTVAAAEAGPGYQGCPCGRQIRALREPVDALVLWADRNP